MERIRVWGMIETHLLYVLLTTIFSKLRDIVCFCSRVRDTLFAFFLSLYLPGQGEWKTFN